MSERRCKGVYTIFSIARSASEPFRIPVMFTPYKGEKSVEPRYRVDEVGARFEYNDGRYSVWPWATIASVHFDPNAPEVEPF